MKRIIIGGVAFESVKASTKLGQSITNICLMSARWLRDFDNLYNNPSDTKVRIYHKWLEWFLSYGYIHGCTGNSNTFSIYGEVTTEQNERCYVMITKSHNRIVVEG